MIGWWGNIVIRVNFLAFNPAFLLSRQESDSSIGDLVNHSLSHSPFVFRTYRVTLARYL